MRCEDLRDLRIEWLRGRLPADRAREVEDHLAGCAACRAELDADARLDGLLDLIPGGAPGEGLASRVIARVSRARTYRILRWVSAAAAAVLLAFLLIQHEPGPRLSDEDRDIVNHLDLLENLPLVETSDVVEEPSAVEDIDLAGDLEEDFY